LAVADVTDFAVRPVHPRKGSGKSGGETDLGVRHGLGQLVAGHRGVVIERSGPAASLSATAACLHVRVHTIKDMVQLKGVGCGPVVGAEPAAYAARRAAKSDVLSRGEENHVKGVHVACGIRLGWRQVCGADLGQQFRLDLRIADGAAIVGGRGNDLKQSVKRAISNRLIRAACDRGAVLAQQSDKPAVGDITIEVAHAGRGVAGHLRVK
jgi:hypothetical protein